MHTPCYILYCGSFDPIHIGHINLAQYVAHLPDIAGVWIMPSRRNPLKANATIVTDEQRLEMAALAAEGIDKVSISDEEMGLPMPSFTITTLSHLSSKYPEYKFKLLIGSDNWAGFTKWRDWERIIKEYGILIYPRPGYDIDTDSLPENVAFLQEAPVTDVSSTEIRDIIHNHGDMTNKLPTKVAEYIKRNKLYIAT
jgi:nicotinate-nucleotide adenylyltransferase